MPGSDSGGTGAPRAGPVRPGGPPAPALFDFFCSPAGRCGRSELNGRPLLAPGIPHAGRHLCDHKPELCAGSNVPSGPGAARVRSHGCRQGERHEETFIVFLSGTVGDLPAAPAREGGRRPRVRPLLTHAHARTRAYWPVCDLRVAPSPWPPGEDKQERESSVVVRWAASAPQLQGGLPNNTSPLLMSSPAHVVDGHPPGMGWRAHTARHR